MHCPPPLVKSRRFCESIVAGGRRWLVWDMVVSPLSPGPMLPKMAKVAVLAHQNQPLFAPAPR